MSDDESVKIRIAQIKVHYKKPRQRKWRFDIAQGIGLDDDEALAELQRNAVELSSECKHFVADAVIQVFSGSKSGSWVCAPVPPFLDEKDGLVEIRHHELNLLNK